MGLGRAQRHGQVLIDIDTATAAARVKTVLENTPLPRWCALGAFVWFALMAVRTPVDVDEGYYALASELVGTGKVPYRDFFYPQAPLFPYLLAPFVKIFGSSFVVLRILSAGIAATTTGLVAHAVHRETRSTMATITTAIVFSVHELSWQWLITIRPYELGIVFLLASLLVATPVDRDATPRELLIAGALGAAAPLMRLPMAPALFIAPLAIVFRKTKPSITRAGVVWLLVALGANWPTNWPKNPLVGALAMCGLATIVIFIKRRLDGAREAAIYLVGAAVVALPIAGYFYFAYRQLFLYDLLQYHADSSTFVSFPQNRPYLAAFLGGGALGELTAMGAQNVLLIVLNIVALVLPKRESRMAMIIGSSALLFGAARHAPMSEHYLTPIIPFLAIGAGVTIGYVHERIRSHHGEIEQQKEETVDLTEIATQNRAPAQFLLFAFCIALTLAFFIAGASSIEKKWVYARYGGWRLEEYRPGELDKKLAAVQRVTTKTNPDGPFLCSWPGTALGNATRIMSGYENHFVRLVASQHSPDEAHRLHLTTLDDFTRSIQERKPAVIALDRESGLGADRLALEAVISAAGYKQVEAVGDVAVYAR